MGMAGPTMQFLDWLFGFALGAALVVAFPARHNETLLAARGLASVGVEAITQVINRGEIGWPKVRRTHVDQHALDLAPMTAAVLLLEKDAPAAPDFAVAPHPNLAIRSAVHSALASN